MNAPGISALHAEAFVIPTDQPEADGTLQWHSTTLVLVSVDAGGMRGLGYTYSSASIATLINETLRPLLIGVSALDVPACWQLMRHAVRNLGLAGMAAMAIAAVDTALWDLKARLLGTPLASLFGKIRERVPVYGSGGFLTYDSGRLTAQIEGWKALGIRMAKIKIGATPADDLRRVRQAREALDSADALFVDANGAYSAKQALALAAALHEHDVSWFEEPVSSDDLVGLRLIRRSGPAGMDICAGEYGFDLHDGGRMLQAGAVDVLQIDVTRMQGYTGFLHAASIALAFDIPVSSHCAPALHLPVCCQAANLRHMEYFHDHVRIEQMLFDGVPQVRDGHLAPSGEPGHGLLFKHREAERFAA